MKVLLYGPLVEAIGPEIEVDASGDSSIGELREGLAADHPESAETLASRRLVLRSG